MLDSFETTTRNGDKVACVNGNVVMSDLTVLPAAVLPELRFWVEDQLRLYPDAQEVHIDMCEDIALKLTVEEFFTLEEWEQWRAGSIADSLPVEYANDAAMSTMFVLRIAKPLEVAGRTVQVTCTIYTENAERTIVRLSDLPQRNISDAARCTNMEYRLGELRLFGRMVALRDSRQYINVLQGDDFETVDSGVSERLKEECEDYIQQFNCCPRQSELAYYDIPEYTALNLFWANVLTPKVLHSAFGNQSGIYLPCVPWRGQSLALHINSQHYGHVMKAVNQQGEFLPFQFPLDYEH